MFVEDIIKSGSGVPSNGSLDIEIGTNAANWVVVTVKSWSGGLTNTSDNNIQIKKYMIEYIVQYLCNIYVISMWYLHCIYIVSVLYLYCYIIHNSLL